jgi:hypothetical protein
MQDLPFNQAGLTPTSADTELESSDIQAGNRGIIWLGVIGAVLGLVASAGVWGYALWRPWFEPWDKPWGALVVMTAPYPIALLVSLAGRLNRPLAGMGLAGIAVLSAGVIRLGFVGLFHVPAALVLLLASVMVLSKPWQLSRSHAVAGLVMTAGALVLLLSGAATVLWRPAVQECVIRWELLDGRILWQPAGNEPMLIAQQTPEGLRDDVKEMGLICGLNTMTPREAGFGLAQIAAGGLALLAVPLTAAGLIFLAPLALAAVLGAGSLVYTLFPVPGLVLVAIGAAIRARSLRRDAEMPETGGPVTLTEEPVAEDLEQWRRPDSEPGGP